MAVTLRIIHLGSQPLDGETPLPAGVQVVNNAALGIGVITLPDGTRFGRFDPGEIPYIAGQQASLVLRSMTLLSAVGSFPGAGTVPGAHTGCPISLSAPAPGGGIQPAVGSRVLSILGAPGGNVFTEMGIIPLFSPVPIPPGHQLRFDTTPDPAANGGTPPGPHILQLTFDQALSCKDLWESQPCCPPGTVNCPELIAYVGPNPVSSLAAPFDALLAGIYFTAASVAQFVPQGGGANLVIGSQTVDSTSQISLTAIDPGSGDPPPRVYDAVVSTPGCPDTVLPGILTINP